MHRDTLWSRDIVVRRYRGREWLGPGCRARAGMGYLSNVNCTYVATMAYKFVKLQNGPHIYKNAWKFVVTYTHLLIVIISSSS